ncbi:DUF2637 domain-containing protein [Nonomuraea sp. NPDC059194]|uniref:DUF2637 domain-containing protein n=1 Tax=Nonomuraea sp. NPDC059194 TaxID=3346764 RepID=UPI0036BDC4C9
MATYFDHKAARTAAAADAQARLAEAEAIRAQTALHAEAERRRMQREDAEDRRRDQATRTAAKALAKANRAARRRTAAQALSAGVRARSHAIIGALAMGSPMFIAWGGQYAFGDDVMQLGAAAVTLPIAMEGSVLYTAYLTHRAIEAGLPTGRYRALTWVMAAVAASMNLWHQVDKHQTPADAWAGLQVGVIYAVASVLGIVLWELTAGLKSQVKSKRTAADIRRAAWRRLRYPRLSWAAASIRGAQGCSIEDAWQQAWIDRYGVGPAATRRERRLARSIVRYQRKADRTAAKHGMVRIIDGSIVRLGAESSRSTEGEQAMASLRDFQARRPGILRSVAMRSRSIGSEAIGGSARSDADPAVSIERPESIEDRPTESLERPSIEPPKAVDRAPASRRSIEAAPDGEIEPAPRRSIEEHRATLQELIEAGEIEPATVTAEAIRRTLRCAPKTAQKLRDELVGEEAA